MSTPTTLEAPERLRAAGLRVTVQRVAVLDALRAHPHASAEAVHSSIRTTLGGVALPTVHGILGDLTGAGVVRRVSLPDAGSALYEVQDEFDNHHHLQCVECGRVEDVACAVGEAPCLHPSHDHGMRILEASVTYRAICSDCERNK
ncbi:Fur family ferric uptake transcriptional regulator [Microbacterium ginsengiterrae]|uniref:Fur family ferric uptake transcriptional regulator n=1 Tax=Microbacterium ginsengiterrae TaxID=546115 RepID=A0A7W9CDS5_9MICO|nr:MULTISPECIES: Fur family transcriptional regulator [Microbacterium]MBB5743760.1 Fur family ferric uptake transcriptional regulator [Microbacterium ginsengiterrae]